MPEFSSHIPTDFDIQKIFIATGVDSTVYRYQDLAIKFYNDPYRHYGFDEMPPSLEQIEFYMNVTNQAARLSIPIEVVSGIPLVINPVIGVTVTKDANKKVVPVSISPFVPGVNLSKMDGIALARLGLVKKDMIKGLLPVDKYVNTKLAVRGVEIRPVNIIYCPNYFDDGSEALVVTDLCGRLGNLIPVTNLQDVYK